MRRVHVVLGLALLFGAGCAESTSPAARSADPGPASASDIAWMGTFCTVVDDMRTGLWGSAANSDADAGLRERLGSDLSGAAEALGAAVDGLGSLPKDPPAGGDEAVAELEDQLTSLRAAVVTGQDSLAALPPDATEQDLGRVMGTVWPDVASRAGKPLAGVPLTDAMKAAASGPACSSLSELD